MAHSIDPTIPLVRIEEAAQARQRRFDHALLNVLPEILEALTCLRAEGYRLALLSNASTGEVAAWERSLLVPFFEEAVFSCHCGYRKPQPEIYHHALGQLQLAPQQALFVSDEGQQRTQGRGSWRDRQRLYSAVLRHLDEMQVTRRRAAAKWEIRHAGELPSLLKRLRQA